MIRSIRFYSVLAVVLILSAGCRTGPVEIPEGLTQAEIFQRGQEALDAGRYQNALQYYETFLERFPDDHANIAEARYEIAFIHYKMDDWDRARELFNRLIDDYETEEAEHYPAWPRVLAQRVLVVMDQGGWPPQRDL